MDSGLSNELYIKTRIRRGDHKGKQILHSYMITHILFLTSLDSISFLTSLDSISPQGIAILQFPPTRNIY